MKTQINTLDQLVEAVALLHKDAIAEVLEDGRFAYANPFEAFAVKPGTVLDVDDGCDDCGATVTAIPASGCEDGEHIRDLILEARGELDD